MNLINSFLRKRYNSRNRKRLQNYNFSLICDSCTGGTILHDLGLRFNSPFVNLWIKPDDYLKMLKNIEHYLGKSESLYFVNEEGKTYPIGVLEDVKIYFTHYHTEKEAYEKWNERCRRVDMDNLFVIFTERNGCTRNNLEEFDMLPFKHKIALTHLFYPELVNAVYIKGFEHQSELGIVLKYKTRFTGKKYYDDFDYVSWFNTGKR